MKIAEYKKRFTKKRNKHNARRTFYNGRWYQSALECEYAQELDWRKKAGEIKEIIPQFKIDIRINDIHICNYFIDFKITLADGTDEYHEVKGFEADLWRMKWRCAIALYPEWKFVLIK